MSEFTRKVPIVGRFVETIAKDSPKRKIKNKLRRVGISAAAASALLTSAALAAGLGGSLSLLGEAWEDIDAAIDNLSDDNAAIIETFINLGATPLGII